MNKMMSGVCVEEGDTGVRVHAEVPHLVCLGGGRLSTAVTLHPLTMVITTLGSGNEDDITVIGSGVEKRHCQIHNQQGIFSLHAFAQLTTVDGVPVTQKTRLTQGCIIGLGHTNYFRFNHPVEARMIKNSLPDSKASLLPPTFYQGSYVGIEGLSPNHHQQSRGRDCWDEADDPISPAVLANVAQPQVRFSPNEDEKTPRRLTSPSPAFNRNPTPYIPQKLRVSSPPQARKPLLSDFDRVSLEERERQERQKVEEILAICSEYERQAQLERCGKPVQNRIITNGSLPRDKRLNSPSSPNVQHSFSFDTSDLVNGDDERKAELLKSPHSYENVIITTGSPRPRIKTFLNAKDYSRDLSPESCENKIPLTIDMEIYGKIKPLSSAPSETSRRNSISSETSDGRPRSIAEVTVESKYKFLGYDPRKEFELQNGRITNSSPDYDMMDGSGYKAQSSHNDLDLDVLQRERAELIKEINKKKSRVSELQLQEEELIREAEMEEALVNSEINSQSTKMIQDEKKVEYLLEKMHECDVEMEKCLEQQSDSHERFKLASEKHASIIKTLEHQIDLSVDVSDKQELLEAFKQQHELLDMEKKNHEDLEFRLMEEEAGWLSKKEDLQKELSEAQGRLDSRRQKLKHLRQGSERLNNNLESQRIELLRSIEEGRNRLNIINSELKAFGKDQALIENNDSSTDDDDSWTTKKVDLNVASNGKPRNSSTQTNEESQKYQKSIEEGRNRLININNNLKNLSRIPVPEEITGLEELQKRASQDDLDRISRVTSGAPIDMSGDKLGKRTIASLQEIERNRQLHLAKQGSIVIQEERQRVEELKRRVQDEVRAKWQQERNSNCQSYASATSDESSSNSAEPTQDSGVSSEEAEKLKTPSTDDGKSQIESPQPMDYPDPVKTPESRPLSEASSYSDEQSTIKMRSRSNANLQRPLTRYLPIRSENLDLRQHIETAGHQVDICVHIKLDSVSCRGYLSKMGSRFHTWNKRWFVFDRTKRSLSYFGDRSEKKQRGEAPFQTIEEVYVDHLNNLKTPSPRVTFVVKTSAKVFHLVAPSPEAMRIWVDVIFTGAEGYQQYIHH